MRIDARLRLIAVAFAVALLPATLFAYRLAVPVRYHPAAGGDRLFAAIPVLFVLPILAGLLAVMLDFPAMKRVLRMPWAWIGIACLSADIFVYTLGGFSQRSFKLTSTLTLPYLASMGALFTGIYLWKWRPAALHGLIATSTIASALAGVAQLTQRAGFTSPFGRWMVLWDEAASETFHTTIHFSRAQGFELNPNIYSPAAVVGVLWAIFGMPRGWLRVATLIASSVIAVLSQSRTTILVIIVLLGIEILREAVKFGLLKAGKRFAKVLVIIAILVAGLLVVRFGPMVVTETGLEQQSEGIVVTPPTAEASMAGRFAAWQSNIRAIKANPWGYLEGFRPLSKPLAHPHNEVLFRLLYAGPLWLMVHIVFLVWLATWFTIDAHKWIGYALAAILFVNGLTEPIYQMRPYFVLLYVIIGAMMWAKTAEAEPETAVAD